MNRFNTKEINLTSSEMQINHQIQSKKEEVNKTKRIAIIDQNRRMIKRKRTLPEPVKKAIIIWLKAHSFYPYPTMEEKRKFSYAYGLEERDIITHFTCERIRLFSGKKICHKNMPNTGKRKV